MIIQLFPTFPYTSESIFRGSLLHDISIYKQPTVKLRIPQRSVPYVRTFERIKQWPAESIPGTIMVYFNFPCKMQKYNENTTLNGISQPQQQSVNERACMDLGFISAYGFFIYTCPSLTGVFNEFIVLMIRKYSSQCLFISPSIVLENIPLKKHS